MHAVLVGLGNIGSHAAPLVARTPEITRMTLIDCDRYEAKNVFSQSIAPKEVGKPKAEVWAKRLRALRPGLETQAIVSRVEEIPLGRLRSDVLLAAVDTRLTRQYLNEATWTLDMKWIDGGVQADGGLARVEAIWPGEGRPCFECSWDARHYEALETAFACQAGVAAAATNAPASLGALAGALMAIECRKLLTGQTAGSATGKKVVVDTTWNKHRVTSMLLNPRCRFHHRTTVLEDLAVEPNRLTLAQLFAMVAPEAALRVMGGGGFVKSLRCGPCEKKHQPWRLRREMRPNDARCRECGSAMEVTGFDLSEQTRQADVPAALRASPLSRFGLRRGDVAAFCGEQQDRLFLIGGGGA